MWKCKKCGHDKFYITFPCEVCGHTNGQGYICSKCGVRLHLSKVICCNCEAIDEIFDMNGFANKKAKNKKKLDLF